MSKGRCVDVAGPSRAYAAGLQWFAPDGALCERRRSDPVLAIRNSLFPTGSQHTQLTAFHGGVYTAKTASAPTPANILLWLPHELPCFRHDCRIDPRLRGAGSVRLRAGAVEQRGPGQLRGSPAVSGGLSRRLEDFSHGRGFRSEGALQRSALPGTTCGSAAAAGAIAADSSDPRAVRRRRGPVEQYGPGQLECGTTSRRDGAGVAGLRRGAGTAAVLSGRAAAGRCSFRTPLVRAGCEG